MIDEQAIRKDLNPAQIEAVEHIHGPMMIIAGAGSGKTTTFIRRTANMISQGIDPRSIMAVTFTNKAAQELRNRLVTMVGEVGKQVVAGTFHSIILRHVLRYAATDEVLEKHNLKRNFAVLDSYDSNKILKECFDSQGAQEKAACKSENIKYRDIGNAMSNARAHGFTRDDLLASIEPGESKEFLKRVTCYVWEEYEKVCRSRNGVDFDDILSLAKSFIDHDPQIAYNLSSRFNYIMLDEYQDTNKVQMSIIDAIAGENRNIAVVGDDRQSIYRFRGAEIGIIRTFRERYGDAKIVDLNTNYRSSEHIVNAANASADAMQGRVSDAEMVQGNFNKLGNKPTVVSFGSEEDEARWIIHDIKKKIDSGVHADEIAVLYRNRGVKDPIMKEMVSNNIPHSVIGDSGFFDKKEIRDAMSMLRFATNPDDGQAVLRLVDCVKLGISQKKVANDSASMGYSPYQILDIAAGKKDNVAALLDDMEELGEALAKADADNPLPEGLMTMIWDHYLKEPLYKYLKTTMKTASDAEVKKTLEKRRQFIDFLFADIEKRISTGLTIDEVMEELGLLSMDTVNNEEEHSGTVKLLTVHAAKGLEFPTVYLAGMEDMICPGHSADNEEELEEERRIFYVAITRAEKELHISHATERMVFGSTQKSLASRFVYEIKDHVNHENRIRKKAPKPKNNYRKNYWK